MLEDAKKIKVAVFSIFFLFIIFYGFSRSTDLLFGVKIKNVNINGAPLHSGDVVKEGILQITGNAKNALNLTLNGREISIDQAGEFSETVALLSGYNIVSIKAADKFGYVDEKNYKLIFVE